MSWICCSRQNLEGCIITVVGIQISASARNCYIIDGRSWGSDSTNNSYCYFRGASSSYNPNTFDFGSSSDSMRVYVNDVQIARNQVINYETISEIRLEGFNSNCHLKNLFGRYAATAESRESFEGTFERVEFYWGEGDLRNFSIFGTVNANFELQSHQLPSRCSFENDVFLNPAANSSWAKNGSTYIALVDNAEFQLTTSLPSPIIMIDVDVISGTDLFIQYAEYTGNAYSSELSEIPLSIGNNKKMVHLGQTAATKIIATNIGDSFTINSVKQIQRGLIMGGGAIWHETTT